MAFKTQHKPKRDTQHARELADLKSINNQLKRTISRLRKEITQNEDIVMAATDTIETTQEECPECGSIKLIYFKTPMGKELFVCKDCKNKILIDK